MRSAACAISCIWPHPDGRVQSKLEEAENRQSLGGEIGKNQGTNSFAGHGALQLKGVHGPQSRFIRLPNPQPSRP